MKLKLLMEIAWENRIVRDWAEVVWGEDYETE
jgi:hypothetical protein